MSTDYDLLGVNSGAAVTSIGVGTFVQVSGTDGETGSKLEVLHDLVSLSNSGTQLRLAGPLLSATDMATVSVTNNVLDMESGAAVTGTGPGAFIQVDGSHTMLNSADSHDLVHVKDTGTTLTLAGPLLSVTNGASVSVDNTLLEVLNGAAVTGTGPAPFIQVDGANTTLSVTDLVVLYGTGAIASTTLTLAGPLLSVTGGASVSAIDVLDMFQGAAVSSSSSGALVQVDGTGSLLDVSGDLVVVLNSGTQLSLAGPLLRASGGATVNVAGDVLDVLQGAVVTGTGSGALVQADGVGTLPTMLVVLGDVAYVTDSGTQLSLVGPLLRASGGASVNIEGDVLDIFQGAVVSSTSSGALVQVDGVGTLLVVSGDFAFVTDSGTQLRLAGPLLRVSGGASVNTEGDVLDVLQGAVVTGNGSSAFVQVDGVGSQLTTSIFGNNLVSLSGSGTQLSLGGSLLSVTGGATATLFRGVLGMANGATAVIGGDALIIGAGGGTITGPTDGTPLISVVSTTDLSVGGALVNLASSSSVMNLNGPILSMTGGVATATYGLVMAASASLTPGDPTPAAVALSLPVGTQSLGVAVTPNGAQAYVTDNGGSQVYAINTANDAATPVTVGSHPAGVGITPDGSLAYVANQGSNTVSVIDTSHNMVTATVPGLSTPYFGVAVANVPGVGTRAYVGNLGTNSVAVIDANPLSPTFNTVLTSISVGLGPVGLAVTPDGTRAYVVNQSSNSVSVIDNTTNTVIGSAIPVGSLPGSIIITPDGTKAYVANGVGNTLSVISTATNTVTGTVNVGAPAGGLAISPDGTRLYVTNGSPANTLTIINTADNSIVGTAISVGNSPAGIAVTPDGFRAFVAINGDPEFSIVAGLTAPLFQVAGGSLTMNSNLVFLPATASLTLTHPLLDVINTGSVTANADLISVGGTLAVNGLAPLVKVGGQGMLTLNGSLLSQNGSGSVNLGGSVLRVDAGGTVVSASTASVVLLPSGTHSFGSSAGSALFDLSGNPANTATEVDQGNTLTLGTDRPIKGAGDCSSDCSLQVSLLETGGTGTTTVMVGGSAVKIDTALLESSLPILNLKPGSSLTLGADAVDLSMKAKVTSLGAFLKLDGASLTVDVGSLVNVRNGSFLSVMGDLLQLSNSSTLTLNSLSDGFLVNISGGSVLKVSGALVAFTAGAGNSVIVKNTVSPNATVDGVPVHLANGATISQVDIGGTPIRVNAGAAGSLTFLNTGSLINVDGPTAKISISGLTPP